MESARLEARRATAEDVLHQLELACRRQLSERLSEHAAGLPPQERAQLAQRLNACKREVLAEARAAFGAAIAEAEGALGGGVEEREGASGHCWVEPSRPGPDMGAALACWTEAFDLHCSTALALIAQQPSAGPGGKAGPG